MADIADKANDTVEICTAEAEHRARGKSAPETHPDFNGRDCVDCGDLIPVARIWLGKIRCVDCQRELEGRRARGLA